MTGIDIDKQIEFSELVDNDVEKDTTPSQRRVKNTTSVRTGRRVVKS